MPYFFYVLDITSTYVLLKIKIFKSKTKGKQNEQFCKEQKKRKNKKQTKMHTKAVIIIETITVTTEEAATKPGLF